jgi:hypothetical protein
MISLTPPAQPVPSKFNDEKPVIVDQDLATERADKASYGLEAQADAPDARLVQGAFLTGGEDMLRRNVLVREQIAERKKRMGQIQEVAQLATQEGREISAAERQYLMELSSTDFAGSPNTILERLYAKRVVEDTVEEGNLHDDSVFGDAVAENSSSALATRTYMEDLTAKGEIANRLLEEASQRVSDSSWQGISWDFVKGLIPMYTWYQQRNAVEDVGASNFFLGQNVQEQMAGLWALPPEEFEVAARAAIDKLGSENVLEALTLASSIVSYTQQDAAWDNVFTGLDAVDVATLGGSAIVSAAVTANTKFAKTAKATVQAVSNAKTPVARAVAQGNIEVAADKNALTRLNGVLPGTQSTSVEVAQQGTNVQKAMNDLAKSGSSLLDSKEWTRNVGTLSNERATRVLDNLTHNAQLLTDTLFGAPSVGRLSDDAAAAAFKAAERDLRRQYSNIEDSIVDISPVRESEDIAFGVDRIEALFGMRGAVGFSDPAQAIMFARDFYKFPQGSYKIKTRGGNYLISVSKTVREDSLDVLDARILTQNAQPVDLTNTFLGLIASPDNLLSKEATRQRKAVTYGSNVVMERMKEVTKPFEGMSKESLGRLRTVIQDGKDQWQRVIDIDGIPRRVQGAWHENIGQLEQAFLKRFKSLPSDQEIQAYFTFRQLSDWDFVQRNLGMLRDKSRLGIEQISVGIIADGKYTQSPFFEGRLIEGLPNAGDGEFTVGFINPTNNKAYTVWNTDPGYLNQQKVLKELIESKDYKVVQLADERNAEIGKAFKSGGSPLNFVVVRKFDSKPLSTSQIPYTEGGHWNYPDNGVYIKQTQSHKSGSRRIVDGDTTALFLQSTKDGSKFREAIEVARRMLLDPNHDKAAFDKFVRENLPFKSGKAFARMFKDAPGASSDAPFNLNTPFVVTESGQSASDLTKLGEHFPETIYDPSSSIHSLGKKVNTQYAQQRNERLRTIDTEGTEASPVFKLRPAPMVDPLRALARDSANLAKSRFFEDYKHTSVEEWAHQFGHLLKATKAEVMSDPMKFLRNPEFIEGGRMAPELAAAKNARRSILTLLNVDNDAMSTMKWARQKVVDQAVGKKNSKLVEPWAWTENTDPTAITRSAVFDFKLGLFNVLQFPLQAQTTLAAAAIDGNPVRSAQSVYAYWTMRMMGLADTNVKAQGAFSKATGKALGISTDTVTEMYEAFRRSGMDIVGGEVGRLDDQLNPKQFWGPSSAGGKFLDAGRFFFKEGERMNRGVAFSLSYLRWKEMNPKARLTDRALSEITARADVMSLSMTRASNAAWQSGQTWPQKLLSIPTQFFAYHARLSDALLGKQLNWKEKFRLYTVFGAMYGVPVGVAGAALGSVLPVHEMFQTYALENNVDLDQNVFVEGMTQGLGHLVIKGLTGEDYDFAGRYGPGGLTWMGDLYNLATGSTNTSAQDIFGAGPNFFGDLWASTDAVRMSVVSAFNPNVQFDAKPEDFLDVLRNISSVNNTVRAYQIWNAGQWLTKSGRVVAEYEKNDPFNTLAVALGLSPNEVVDAYLKLQSNKDFQAAKTSIQTQAIQEFQRAMKALQGGNEEEYFSFINRAKAIMATGDFTEDEITNTFRRALQQNGTLVESVDYDFMVRAPEDRYGQWWEDTVDRTTTRLNNASE